MAERGEGLNRRSVLKRTVVSGVGITAVTGCLGLGSNSDGSSGGNGGTQSFDPPNAVYKPQHMDKMTMVGMSKSSGIMFGTMHAAAHPFLNVQSSNTKQVSVGDSDMHLMVKPWAMESGVVPSTASFSTTVKKDGSVLTEPTMWPMLSQPMGFHFGENVSLDGPGTYTVEMALVPPTSEMTGKVPDVFGERVENTIEFEVKENTLDYGIMPLDGSGEKGAIEPSKMGKKGQLPAPDELPGELIGKPESDDAVFAVTMLEDVSRFDAGDKTYLAVSPRTPYNRYPLSNMTMSATVERDGETVFDDSLTETLDHELDLHHGAVLDEVKSGDTITLSVDGGRPNVSRHTGYDTAFLDIQDVEVAV